LRKDIARILTVINEKRREKAAKKYHKKKQKPLDQRAKRTRAMRRRLTPFEQSRKTVKQLKKLRSNPRRKYALEA
jgi:large subunit ribosomal protein L35e